MSHQCLCLAVNVLVSLAKVTTALRVTNDAVSCTNRGQHCWRGLTSKCTRLLPVHILSRESNRRVGLGKNLRDTLKVYKRWSNNNINVSGTGSKLIDNSLSKLNTLSESLIHLPVTCDHTITHREAPPLLEVPYPQRAPWKRRHQWKSSSSCQQGGTC